MPPKPGPATYEQQLVTAARNVARLQTRMRKLRRQLKATQRELSHEKKMLRALMTTSAERRPDAIPSRVFGDAIGIVPAKVGAGE